jgi:uncharacterized protein
VDITPRVPADRKIVSGYGGGGFRINAERVEGSVLIFPDRWLAWNGVPSLASLAPVIEDRASELLLLGCGPSLVPVPPDIRAALRAAGKSVEPMDTGAACRTYAVLLGEGRRVAAALIALP